VKLFARFWRWLWKDWDFRPPANIGKAQLEVAIKRNERERRHLEKPYLTEEERQRRRRT